MTEVEGCHSEPVRFAQGKRRKDTASVILSEAKNLHWGLPRVETADASLRSA